MEERKGEAKHWEQQTEKRKVHKGSSTQLRLPGSGCCGRGRDPWVRKKLGLGLGLPRALLPPTHSQLRRQAGSGPLTLAVGLGAAPLALTTRAAGHPRQVEVGVTPKIHPGSVQGWEVPARQEHLPIFQHQIRLGADSDTAAGGVHLCPGAVGQALADLGPHHLALSAAHVLNLVVHGQEADSLHLVPSQAPVPDAPFPGRVYDLATFRAGVGGLRPARALRAEEERRQQQQQQRRRRRHLSERRRREPRGAGTARRAGLPVASGLRPAAPGTGGSRRGGGGGAGWPGARGGRRLDNTSVGNSPNPSSLENSFRADRFRADRPSSLPLDFNDEFLDLNGVVQQRRQELGGYSSSGSQTPESENSRDFHVTESQTVLSVSKGEAKPTRADVQVNRAPEGKAKSLPAHGQSESIGILHKVKSQNHPTLRHILIFYAVVVCALILSTFYMRYRINTLEEQLGSLTSIMDTHHAEQAAPSSLGSQVQLNAEALCRELTVNIMKLEKIQNNLQKLLENGD